MKIILIAWIYILGMTNPTIIIGQQYKWLKMCSEIEFVDVSINHVRKHYLTPEEVSLKKYVDEKEGFSKISSSPLLYSFKNSILHSKLGSQLKKESIYQVKYILPKSREEINIALLRNDFYRKLLKKEDFSNIEVRGAGARGCGPQLIYSRTVVNKQHVFTLHTHTENNKIYVPMPIAFHDLEPPSSGQKSEKLEIIYFVTDTAGLGLLKKQLSLSKGKIEIGICDEPVVDGNKRKCVYNIQYCIVSQKGSLDCNYLIEL